MKLQSILYPAEQICNEEALYLSNGDMGWWAIVSNEKDPNAWDKEYKEFIENLPEDAELTMLDCHI